MTKIEIIILCNIAVKHVVKQFGKAISCMVSKRGLDTNNWLLGLEISAWWWGMGLEIRLKHWSYLWTFLAMNSIVIVLVGLYLQMLFQNMKTLRTEAEGWPTVSAECIRTRILMTPVSNNTPRFISQTQPIAVPLDLLLQFLLAHCLVVPF